MTHSFACATAPVAEVRARAWIGSGGQASARISISSNVTGELGLGRSGTNARNQCYAARVTALKFFGPSHANTSFTAVIPSLRQSSGTSPRTSGVYPRQGHCNLKAKWLDGAY